MKAARWRIAGEGEFEKEWNRLSDFSRARVSTEGPVEVEAEAFWDSVGDWDFADTFLVCSKAFAPSGRLLLLRSEPKLRDQDGLIAHLRRAWDRLCRRAGVWVDTRTP
jgi:hypothetical protein